MADVVGPELDVPVGGVDAADELDRLDDALEDLEPLLRVDFDDDGEVGVSVGETGSVAGADGTTGTLVCEAGCLCGTWWLASIGRTRK